MVDNSRKFNAGLVADYAGLLASGLCFIHCWMLPLLLIFVPGLMIDSELAHPVLCSIAIVSNAPLLFKKKTRLQSWIFQIALVAGNVMMILILFAHDHFTFAGELVLSSIGGLCLIYVHYNNLVLKKERCKC
jgi:hypothetical protein